MSAEERPDRVLSAWLWLSLFGGGVVWLLHFLLAWALSEWGCERGSGVLALGISGTNWLLLLMTGVILIAAAAITWFSIHLQRRLAGRSRGPSEEDVLRVAVRLNLLFLFIIMVETIPVFYFLQRC